MSPRKRKAPRVRQRVYAQVTQLGRQTLPSGKEVLTVILSCGHLQLVLGEQAMPKRRPQQGSRMMCSQCTREEQARNAEWADRLWLWGRHNGRA